MDKNYLYFIQDEIAAIERDILAIPQKQFDDLFNKIATYGPLEIDVLKALLTVIQDQKEHYRQKQHILRNNTQLRYITSLTLILFILFAVLYYWLLTDTANHAKVQEFIEQLKPYGITVREHSQRSYKSMRYWLQCIPTKNLTQYQWIHANSIIKQLYELHTTIYGKNRWIFIIIFCGILCSIKPLFLHIRRWLKPQYKERYEKYILLENIIKEKITQLSSPYKIRRQ